MRHLDEIIIHCTATVEGKNYTVKTIDRWHKDRGWKGIGYHYVVYLDGSIHEGRPLAQQGAHVSGHNKSTAGVVYVGGLDKNKDPKDTRTAAQKKSLHKICKDLVSDFPTIKKISGHNQYANKACPCFSVPPEFSYIVDGSPPPVSEKPVTTDKKSNWVLPVFMIIAAVGVIVVLATR